MTCPLDVNGDDDGKVIHAARFLNLSRTASSVEQDLHLRTVPMLRLRMLRLGALTALLRRHVRDAHALR